MSQTVKKRLRHTCCDFPGLGCTIIGCAGPQGCGTAAASLPCSSSLPRLCWSSAPCVAKFFYCEFSGVSPCFINVSAERYKLQGSDKNLSGGKIAVLNTAYLTFAKAPRIPGSAATTPRAGYQKSMDIFQCSFYGLRRWPKATLSVLACVPTFLVPNERLGHWKYFES